MVNTDILPGITFHVLPFSNDAAVYTINRQATCSLTRSQRLNIRRRLFYIPVFANHLIRLSHRHMCLAVDTEIKLWSRIL